MFFTRRALWVSSLLQTVRSNSLRSFGSDVNRFSISVFGGLQIIAVVSEPQLTEQPSGHHLSSDPRELGKGKTRNLSLLYFLFLFVYFFAVSVHWISVSVSVKSRVHPRYFW
ncbi:hypothetical protein M9H77_34056 [Catharanthus roseus]|uniref:Uncharacterized protein n=1 Tax=Catharanthus roseus TaxID=4058 RepID=A0ACB9ZK16_CATRO|nr:hypothetical protein M9H77_34056 [Catharanthus roseus]